MPLLAGTLAEMVNTSLRKGIFPNALKHAIVRPRLKKPSLDPDDVNSYRPISNLSFVSKIVERVVVSRFDEHVETQHLLPDRQSAYRATYSTETAVIAVHDSIVRTIDSGDVCAPCVAWFKFSFWYCWPWNTYACTATAFWRRGSSSDLVWLVPVWSNPSLLPQHTAVWTLQSWLQCATRVSARTKGVHRLHRRIGCTHRQLPAWSASVRWWRSADEAHMHQQRRNHHPDSAAMHQGHPPMVFIKTTSAESIEDWSYLVWHITQFEKDGRLRSQPSCEKWHH